MLMSNWLAKEGFRIFGAPPPKGAPKVEAWKYVRRIYVRLLPFTVPLWVLVPLAGAPTWLWIVLGVGALTWLQGFGSVSLRIKRLQGVPPDG
jgi:hypothetical protein